MFKYIGLILAFYCFFSLKAQEIKNGIKFELKFEKNTYLLDEQIFYEMIFINVNKNINYIPNPYDGLTDKIALYNLNTGKQVECLGGHADIISEDGNWPKIELEPKEGFYYNSGLSLCGKWNRSNEYWLMPYLAPGKYKFIVEYSLIYNSKTDKNDGNTFTASHIFEIIEPTDKEKDVHVEFMKIRHPSLNRTVNGLKRFVELLQKYPNSAYASSIYWEICSWHFSLSSYWPNDIPTFNVLNNIALEKFKDNMAIEIPLTYMLIPNVVSQKYKYLENIKKTKQNYLEIGRKRDEMSVLANEILIEKYPNTKLENYCKRKIKLKSYVLKDMKRN